MTENELRQEALKPCPFCGSQYSFRLIDNPNGRTKLVQCGCCMAEGPVPRMSLCEGTDAAAIEAWNVRTPPAALTAARDERAGGWQSMDSAPKDGTKFDAWVPDAFGGHRMTGLSFNRRGQLRQHGLLTAADLPRWPTHWRPPPPPPST